MKWTTRTKQTDNEWFAEIATLAYINKPIELQRDGGVYAGMLFDINKKQIISKTETHNMKSSYNSIVAYREYTTPKGEWKTFKYNDLSTDMEMTKFHRSTGLVIQLSNGDSYQVDKINRVNIQCHAGNSSGKINTRHISKYRSGLL